MLSLNEKPRSAIDAQISLPWFMFHFHEGAGATVSDRAGLVSDKTVEGVTTNIWDNPTDGITCSNTNHFLIPQAEVDPVFDVRNFKGHLLIAFDLYYGATPTDREYLCNYGDGLDAATDGEIAIEVNNTGNTLYLVYRNAGGSVQNIAMAGTLATATKHKIALDLAYSDSGISYTWYKAGAVNKTGSITDDGTGRPGATDAGFRMLGRTYNSAVSRALNLYNSGARLENFLAARIGDASAGDIPQIVSELASYPGDLPWGLADS